MKTILCLISLISIKSNNNPYIFNLNKNEKQLSPVFQKLKVHEYKIDQQTITIHKKEQNYTIGSSLLFQSDDSTETFYFPKLEIKNKTDNNAVVEHNTKLKPNPAIFVFDYLPENLNAKVQCELSLPELLSKSSEDKTVRDNDIKKNLQIGIHNIRLTIKGDLWVETFKEINYDKSSLFSDYVPDKDLRTTKAYNVFSQYNLDSDSYYLLIYTKDVIYIYEITEPNSKEKVKFTQWVKLSASENKYINEIDGEDLVDISFIIKIRRFTCMLRVDL
jgi:hypothetical protein